MIAEKNSPKLGSMFTAGASKLRLRKSGDVLIGSFTAMGCPCEILMDTSDIDLAKRLLFMGANEAWRIEKKFSRYVAGNIVDLINQACGKQIVVDSETADLIDFAKQCFDMSGGLFDITSGILRKAWTFDGSDRIPDIDTVTQLLPLVGWDKVRWHRPVIELNSGMQIDLGGIGKEYAVDRTLQFLMKHTDCGCLVNFGGDIAIGSTRRDNAPWVVGIESHNKEDQAVRIIHVTKGALATSGDSKKFLFANNTRYGHILDPRTACPVENAPRSVTVAAGTCTEAGFLSTLAILHGKDAEQFLSRTGFKYWCYR